MEDDKSSPMLQIILVAFIVGGATLIGCTLWQQRHDQAEVEHALEQEMANLDEQVQQLKLGNSPSKPETYVAKPAPLPARQPAITAIVVVLIIVGIGRTLVFMDRMEQRTGP